MAAKKNDKVKKEKNPKDQKWVAFGEWIVAHREQQGLTQDQAAKLIGVDRQTWYRWENGRPTRLSNIAKIADIVKGDPNEAFDILKPGSQARTSKQNADEVDEFYLRYSKLNESKKQTFRDEWGQIIRKAGKDVAELLRQPSDFAE